MPRRLLRSTAVEPPKWIKPQLTRLVDDPRYWRAQADEARQLSCSIDYVGVQDTMENIAKTYDRLADLAASIESQRTPRN